MPEISVIIPAYNCSKTIHACLSSIFKQIFNSFEIIVVNDGSTDSTSEILNDFKGKIKIINQENRGAAVARNRGEKEASCPFIIFLDADIIAKPKMLEKMYQALKEHPEASYAYSAFKFGWKTFRLFPFSPEKLKKIPYIHTSSLIRHECFPGFDERLKRFQDWDLWLTMLKDDHRGYFIPDVLFKVKSGGTMSSWLPKIFYRLPWQSKKVIQYQRAETIIRNKHNL